MNETIVLIKPSNAKYKAAISNVNVKFTLCLKKMTYPLQNKTNEIFVLVLYKNNIIFVNFFKI